MAELALKLRGRCPHCGGSIIVAFRKEMASKDARLLAAVWHEDDPFPPEWKPVSGFDDVRGFIPVTEEQVDPTRGDFTMEHDAHGQVIVTPHEAGGHKV